MWMKGGWIQTALVQNDMTSQVDYKRINMPFLGTGLDVVQSHNLSNDAPILFALHGQGCTTGSPSIVSLAKLAAENGWRLIACIRRGHHEFKVKKGDPFPQHVELNDMNTIVEYVQTELYPSSSKYAMVGFSAGGNIATKYLGSLSLSQENHKFVCGVSVENAYNGNAFTQDLKTRNWLGDAALKEKFIGHFDHNNKDPRAFNCKHVRDFDEYVIMSDNGYDSIDEFYRHNCSHEELKITKIPILCVASLNDPILPATFLSYVLDACDVNDNVLCLATETGGHLGWYQGKDQYWLAKIIMEYINNINILVDK
jgi:predicted alpha/beta-fold hydrolase